MDARTLCKKMLTGALSMTQECDPEFETEENPWANCLGWILELTPQQADEVLGTDPDDIEADFTVEEVVEKTMQYLDRIKFFDA